MATLQKKTSRGHTYWQIVESKRVNGKPRPIVLLHLGTAETLLKRLLQSDGKPIKARTYDFGAVAALWNVAQELDVVGTIDRVVKKRKQGLSCGQYILLAALNRCVAATSKASLYGWYKKTVLQRLLPVSERQLSSQRFWDHMNYLDAPTIAHIEEAFTQRLIDHFNIDLKTLLFDATNFDTYIDTQTESALVQRGHAKSKRTDLRILGLALLVSTDFHLPLLSMCYPGNHNDPTMFKSVAQSLAARYHQFAETCDHITLVFDGGNTSADNIAAIKEQGYHFVTSLTTTYHQDLLAIPLDHYQSLTNPRLKECQAFRTSKEVWGTTRCVVITRNQKLLEGQIAGIIQGLQRKWAAVSELKQKLFRSQQPKAKGKKYTPLSLRKKLDDICSGQYIKDILVAEITDRDGTLDFTVKVDHASFDHLIATRLGKRILCTDNDHWTTEEIILASRAQHHIESAFKQMKSPHWVSFSPGFHWTDQKLRVHAFSCIIALMLCSLLQRKADHAGLVHTIPSLLGQLSEIEEIVNLYSTGSDTGRGRLRAEYLLSERSPLQEKLCRLFDLHRLTHT